MITPMMKSAMADELNKLDIRDGAYDIGHDILAKVLAIAPPPAMADGDGGEVAEIDQTQLLGQIAEIIYGIQPITVEEANFDERPEDAPYSVTWAEVADHWPATHEAMIEAAMEILALPQIRAALSLSREGK